jgi:purine nucleoside phosphorylase
MSGAPEIALAGAMGIPTAMIGLVTNWASGITGDPLRHEDVLETAGTAVAKLRQLVEKFVQLGPDPGANSGCGLPGQRV